MEHHVIEQEQLIVYFLALYIFDTVRCAVVHMYISHTQLSLASV